MPSLRLSKWGNSVGIRIPTEYLRLTGMKAGDHLEANFDTDGALTLRSVAFSRKAFALELAAQQHDMPMGESVIEALRQGARY
ncbi:MAG: AbrB/MazE/SpoVT family DNA-binding domain-containing protein [Burkholderiaceae bacterium]|nr:AbrB/MazE/SpoVT family DNA-binding domain-containing protein [Burkholderiaceae bacterium]